MLNVESLVQSQFELLLDSRPLVELGTLDNDVRLERPVMLVVPWSQVIATRSQRGPAELQHAGYRRRRRFTDGDATRIAREAVEVDRFARLAAVKAANADVCSSFGAVAINVPGTIWFHDEAAPGLLVPWRFETQG